MSGLGKLAKSLKAKAVDAKGLGFFENTVYHGTAAKPSTTMADGNIFDEFQLWEGQDPTRSTVRSPVSKLGVSLADSPEIAEDFASLASRNGSEGSTVLPLRFRADQVGRIDLDGLETNDEIYSAVADAWASGFDAVQFRNYTTPQGTKGTFVLAKNPSQIRSVHADFDPAKKESSSLMAGLGALGVGGAILSSSGQVEASPLERAYAVEQHSAHEFLNSARLGVAAPVQDKFLGGLANYLSDYNQWVDSKPGLDMLLPEAPVDIVDKWSYGQKTTWDDDINAALGLL